MFYLDQQTENDLIEIVHCLLHLKKTIIIKELWHLNCQVNWDICMWASRELLTFHFLVIGTEFYCPLSKWDNLQQVIVKHSFDLNIGISEVIGERKSRNVGWKIESLCREIIKIKRCFLLEADEIIVKDYVGIRWGALSNKVYWLSIQEIVFNALERERKNTHCQQRSEKLEGDKVFTYFTNI